jgi:hypothetical protein
MNYGIWMTSSEKIMAGFETSSGSDQYVTSPNAYNDDKWHYAVVTYGGSTVILYIDGVQIGTKSTSGSSPETSGTKPIRVGANSRITPPGNFFVGQIDEVRVWNDDITAQQAANAFAGTDFTVAKQVLHLPFGNNSPPVANNQVVNVIQDNQTPITLTATDPDNNPLSYSIVAQALHGTVAPIGPGTASRTYTPNTGYLGPDSFTFKANDGTVDSNVATVSVNVKLSDPPVANNQNVDVIKNTIKSITLTATDPDSPTLIYSVVIPTENGTLSGTAPNLTYNPDANFIGTDSFTFKANDGSTDSNIAAVYITIQNGQPVANAQSVTVIKNTAKSITLSATDPNNDPLTYAIVTPPSHGVLSPSGTGGPSRTYTPTTDYVGPDSFAFKANDGTVDSNVATVSIAVAAPQQAGYNYAPSLVLTGTNYHDEPDSANLRLTQFTVAAWFKTSANFASEAFIVNKGGIGSDSAGQNQNYQISMTSAEQIKVGFETSTGADQFLTSPLPYNDGQWHYALVTNDGSTLTLYIDGAAVTSKSVAGSSPENTGTKPVRIGANSRVTPSTNFFTGEVDEVRVWNDDLTAQQVSAAFAGTSFNTATQKLYLDFGTSMATGYQYGPSLSLTGP